MIHGYIVWVYKAISDIKRSVTALFLELVILNVPANFIRASAQSNNVIMKQIIDLAHIDKEDSLQSQTMTFPPAGQNISPFTI